MRDVLAKMRECGKDVKMRDFPHDCGMVDTYVHTPLVKHSNSFIPAKVLPSPLDAMVLYCYHRATYYSANLYRVVDLYFKTRHFILFYSLWCLHGIVSPYIIGVTVILYSCCSTGADWQDNILIEAVRRRQFLWDKFS